MFAWSLRIWCFCFGIVPGYILHNIFAQRRCRDERERLRVAARLLQGYARFSLRVIGIRIHLHGAWPSQPCLIISNHMGYLDVVVLSALRPLRFITSVEIEHTPFLGDLARLGGSLFVERRRPHRLKAEITHICETIRGGHAITLFPEGTSSSGRDVLPFKGALLTVAQECRRPVRCIALAYTRIGGRRASTQRDRDSLCWYGDRDFVSHFLDLLRVGRAEAHIDVLSCPDLNQDRGEFARACQRTIRSAYRQRMGFPTKV